jgi:hypothetical protein
MKLDRLLVVAVPNLADLRMVLRQQLTTPQKRLIGGLELVSGPGDQLLAGHQQTVQRASLEDRPLAGLARHHQPALA